MYNLIFDGILLYKVSRGFFEDQERKIQISIISLKLGEILSFISVLFLIVQVLFLIEISSNKTTFCLK